MQSSGRAPAGPPGRGGKAAESSDEGAIDGARFGGDPARAKVRAETGTGTGPARPAGLGTGVAGGGAKVMPGSCISGSLKAGSLSSVSRDKCIASMLTGGKLTCSKIECKRHADSLASPDRLPQDSPLQCKADPLFIGSPVSSTYSTINDHIQTTHIPRHTDQGTDTDAATDPSASLSPLYPALTALIRSHRPTWSTQRHLEYAHTRASSMRRHRPSWSMCNKVGGYLLVRDPY